MRPRLSLCRAGLAAGLATLALVAGCGDEQAAEPRSPVLLLGIDGLEPSIVNALIAKGRLPHLARFAQEGVLGAIETLEPTYSPVIWTTVATGRHKETHGVVDFLEAESGQPFTSNARRVPALWNLASEAERTVDVVGWWITWPAESIRGRMLASFAAQAQAHIVWKPGVWEGLPELSWPRGLVRELAPIIQRAGDVDGLRAEFWRAMEQRRQPPYAEPLARCVQDLRWTFNGDWAFAETAEWMLDEGPQADLMLVYLSAPDVAGHRFWRYHAPEDFPYAVDEADVRDFGHVLEASYIEADRRLGRLLERVSADTNVIVMSDHGMHADPENVGLADPDAINSGHHQTRPPGVFAALGPDIRAAGNRLESARPQVGHVLGVAPLVLRLMGLGIPEDWPMGQPGTNALESAVLSDAFLLAHDHELVESVDGDFRAPTAPLPTPGAMNEQFIQILDDMGYLDRDEEDE